MKYLSMIDSSGRRATFLIQNKTQHSSAFGGIMTILLYLITIVLAFIMGSELIYRKNPSVYLSNKFDYSPEELTINNNFEFMIGLLGLTDFQLNKRIFRIEVLLLETNQLDKLLAIEPCDETFKDNETDLFSQYDKSNFYCISRNQPEIGNKNVSLEGYTYSNYSRAIQIQIYECQNFTQEDNCVDKEIIDYNLEFAVLTIIMQNHYIDSPTFKTPFLQGYQIDNYVISNTYIFTLSFYLKHLYMFTDVGYIFSSIIKQQSSQITQINQAIFHQKVEPYFVAFAIHLSNNIDQYHRKYYKFQDLLAQTGGIYQGLLLIFMIVESCFNEHNFFEYLVNSYFEINSVKTKLERVKNSSKKILQKSNIPSEISAFKDLNHQISLISSSFNIPMMHPSVLNNKVKKKKQLRLNIFDKAICLTLCSRSKCVRNKNQNVLYFIGKAEIEKLLDIESIIKIFHSYKMMQGLLINEQNDKQFDYIFQPILSENGAYSRFDNKKLSTKKKLFGKNTVYMSMKNEK